MPLPEINTQTEAFYRDPNSVLGAGPDRPEFCRGAYGVEALGYDLVRGVFREKRFVVRDAEYFRNAGATPLVMEFIDEGNMNFMPPAEHDRLRAILIKGFPPRRIEATIGMMKEVAEDLVGRVVDKGRCDMVRDISHYYSIAVMARYIGVPPEDVHTFDQATIELRLLGQVPMAPGIPRLEAALVTLRDYTIGMIAKRRKNPGEDFISEMIRAQDAGEKISEKELVWTIAFLLLAGHDTTRFTLAGIIKGILDAGRWEELAAHPEFVPAAVKEGMRYYPGTPRHIRTAAEDFEYGGRKFAKGEILVVNLSAAGRDPRVFTEPQRFQLDRPEPVYDIGFGYGRHFCVGHALARTEMEQALLVLTRRLKNVRFDGPQEVKPTGVIAGFERMPVAFDRR